MARDEGRAFVVDRYAMNGPKTLVRRRPSINEWCLRRCRLLRGIVESVRQTRRLVEIEKLDATVFVAGIACSVCGVEGQTERGGWEEEGPE